MPSFSVIITTHERPALLGRAIRSVKAQVGGPVQVVLICDSPCSETYGVASPLLSDQDVFVQRTGTPGPAESRNLGIQLASGDFVLFLDDDDALSPSYLQNAVGHANSSEVIYTDYLAVYERLDGAASTLIGGERRSLAEHVVDSIHIKNFIPPACLVYPRRAIAERRFDPALILNEDWEFILNVMTSYPLRYVPIDGPVVFTRDNPDNRGRSNNHLLEATFRTIYRNRPAPTDELKQERQALFASVGLSASLAEL